ncbi:MAG: 50S ribosomal protein L29 [Myxococcota bacterium]|nr:50S ribosomal protein L29 [Myxococcota bacterium]
MNEIRESSQEELRGRLSRLEGELFQLKLRHATNQLENTAQIRSTRREIARVLTVMAEKERAAAQASRSAVGKTE